MKAVLVTTPPHPHNPRLPGERVELVWTTAHPASHYGLGVLLFPDEGPLRPGEILDGDLFRFDRDLWGWWIETDDPEKVAGALGVPVDEPGIEVRP